MCHNHAEPGSALGRWTASRGADGPSPAARWLRRDTAVGLPCRRHRLVLASTRSRAWLLSSRSLHLSDQLGAPDMSRARWLACERPALCRNPLFSSLASNTGTALGWSFCSGRGTLRPRRQHPLHVAGHSRRTWAIRAATSTCCRRRRRRRVLCDGGGKEGWCGRPLFNRNPVYRMCVCVIE